MRKSAGNVRNVPRLPKNTESSIQTDDLAYLLHHALDPVNLQVADKVFRLRCLQTAKRHFDWDFVNDIGVINLLRKDYLSHGDLSRVFNLYQSTRRDEQFHRYESLLATLVITIAGTFIGGVLVEQYKDYKSKLARWLRKKVRGVGISEEGEKLPDILQLVIRSREGSPIVRKFCDSTAEQVNADFRTLVRCSIARKMLDEGLISITEYPRIVGTLLGKVETPAPGELLVRLAEFEAEYSSQDDAIRPEKVLLVVDGCGKEILANTLDAIHVPLKLPRNTNTADIFRGIPASSGAVLGKARVFPPASHARPLSETEAVLVVDSDNFTPDCIDLVRSSSGVVTTHCGMTGHLPLICRAYGKGCVVLDPGDFREIRNGDAILICGTSGVVATGVIAESGA